MFVLMMINMFLRVKILQSLPKKLRNSALNHLITLLEKNNKYVATLLNGKKVHFGLPKNPDFLIHQDEVRKERDLARAKKIKNRNGEFTWEKPESANYWSTRLLWDGK